MRAITLWGGGCVGFGGYGTGEGHGRVNHCGERGAKTAGLAYIWG